MSEKEKKKKSHSCFEWIQLLVSISIPVAIAVYTVLESNRELAISRANRAHDLNLADDQQKDFILHECQKVLNKLMEKYGTDFNTNSSASLVARFAVLSALDQLDVTRRNFLIRLLYEAQLITCRTADCQPAVDLRSANLIDFNLATEYQRPELFNLSLRGAVLVRANFSGMNIHGSRFEGAFLNHASFASSSNTLDGVACNAPNCREDAAPQLSFERTNLTSATFFYAVYDRVSFKEANMNDANLEHFFCERCSFMFTEMSRVNLRQGVIKQSNMIFSALKNANLVQVTFDEDVEFFHALMQHVNASFARFFRCQFIDSYLHGAFFEYTSFTNTVFNRTQMPEVSMQHSRTVNVTFTLVDLTRSSWQYAYCKQCIFDRTNFTGADLSHATFVQCDFTTAIITESQLRQAASLKDSLLPTRSTSTAK